MNRNVCLYCQEIPGAQTQGCLACEIVNRASSPLQTMASEVFPPRKSFNSTPYLQSFQGDAVYSMVLNEAQRWASSSTMPIVQANGVLGVSSWFGSEGQQGLTELERQNQQQIWADVAGGFPQHPNAWESSPINMQLIQPFEPEVLLIYTDDSFVSELANPNLHSMYSPWEGKSSFGIQATSLCQLSLLCVPINLFL